MVDQGGANPQNFMFAREIRYIELVKFVNGVYATNGDL